MHALLSPSASSRWLACPYSRFAPPSESGAAAREGTLAHEWAAKVLRGEVTDVPAGFEKVLVYCQYVRDLRPDRVFIEQWFESLVIDDFGGTIDCLAVRGRDAFIFDLKWGKWPVKLEGNSQLLCYAALASEHFAFEKWNATIIQPRRSAEIKFLPISSEDISRVRSRVREVLKSDRKQVGPQCRFCTLRTTGQCREGQLYALRQNW